MEVKYRPPSNDPEECDFLENNFKRCLSEKAVKDQVPKMTCKVEHILWFFLECPTRSVSYENKDSLRSIFIQDKLKLTNPSAAILKK